MKKIRAIGYKQTFDINEWGLFGKLLKKQPGWLIRGVHYFYVDENADPDCVYRSRYGVRENSDVVQGWGDWHSHSDNVSIANCDCSNVKSEVVELPVSSVPSAEMLYQDMAGDQFKEWFHSGCGNKED